MRQIAGAVEPYREELVGVVIESTYNWYWLVDGLMDAGAGSLANATAIKKYEGLKYSGDFADAAYLAQLLRLGMLPEGYIYPREQRGARDLARKRLQLVRYRTAQDAVDREHAGADRRPAEQRRGGEACDGGTGRGAGLCTRCDARPGIEPRGQPSTAAAHRGAGAAAQGACELALGVQVAENDAGHRRGARHDDHGRTGTSHALPRWATSAPTVAASDTGASNGKKKGEGNAKNGNKYLAWAFVEAADFTCPAARKQSDSTSARSARRTPLWRPRRWRTNWRAPATTCCASRKHAHDVKPMLRVTEWPKTVSQSGLVHDPSH